MTKKGQIIPHGSPPSWLPDWTDETAYLHDDHTPRLWAWEFLRRNQQYQADYQQWMAAGYSRQLEDELCHKWGVSHLNDPAGMNVVIGSYWRDDEAMPPLFLEFESESDSLPPDGSGMGGGRVSLRCGSDFPATDDIRHLFVRFDVRYPLGRQIAAVEELFKARQRGLKEFGFMTATGSKRPHIEKFPEYLRVFDAAWHRVQHKDIAEKLFPGCEWDPPQGKFPKKINNALSSARKLVSGGYRDLLI